MIERIICSPPLPTPRAPALAPRVRLHVDALAYGRGTLRDLVARGYHVLRHGAHEAPVASEPLLYFMLAGEPLPAQLLTTAGTRVVLCPLGEADPELEATCRRHGHAYLPSRTGPSLFRVLEALEGPAP